MDNTKKRPARQPILILSHADGHIEIFGEKNIDVHLSRVPAAFSTDVELSAEGAMELLLPRRYRPLFRADMLRKNGTTRPLLPSVLADSIRAGKDIATLNRVGAK